MFPRSAQTGSRLIRVVDISLKIDVTGLYSFIDRHNFHDHWTFCRRRVVIVYLLKVAMHENMFYQV